MSPAARPAAGTTWLSIPELVELLGVPQGKVRRLLEERILLGTRVDGVIKVPSDFIVEGEPLGDLRGTLVLLTDAGYSDDECMHWLLNDEDSLDTTPVAALKAGRKAEVRRIAQALGF